MTNSIGKKLVSSAGWSIAGDLLVAVSGAATAILAARLLPKDEIGLVGVVSLLLALIETITNSGVEQALVQRAHSIEDVMDSAFTWQLGRGCVIAICLIVGAPYIARFYAEPALEPLTCALALQPLLRGATNINIVVQVRQLAFRSLFLLNAGPALIRLTIVAGLSFALRNAWVLVAATLFEHMGRLLLSYVLHPYRPRLHLRWSEILPLLRFGRWVTALSLLSYFATRADDFFVSKRFDVGALAVYQLAFAVANVPATSISHVVGRVTFPAYARLVGDPERLRLAFREVFGITTLAAFSTAVVLFFVFPYLPAVVGPQWAGAVELGQIFAFGGALRALAATGGPLFQGTGRPDLDVRMNLPRLAVLAALLFPLSERMGLLGASVASLISVLACFPVWSHGVRAQTGLRSRELLAPLGRSLITASIACAIFYTVSSQTARDLPGLLMLTAFGIGGTYAIARLCERVFGTELLPSLQKLRDL